MAVLNRRRAIVAGGLHLVAAVAIGVLPFFALGRSGLDVSGMDCAGAREAQNIVGSSEVGGEAVDGVVDLEKEKARREVEVAKTLLKNVEGAEAHKPALWGKNETEMVRSAERLRRARDGLVGTGAILTAGSVSFFTRAPITPSVIGPFVKTSAALFLASIPFWIAGALVAAKRRSKLKSLRQAEALKSERIKEREAFIASSDAGV